MRKQALRALAACLIVAAASSAFAGAKGTIQFVYIGGSGCGFCKREDYKKRIVEYRDAARQWAQSHGYSFQLIGVATDSEKASGESFLTSSGIGPYDLAVAGQGWAGADPYTKPYRATNPLFLDGFPLESQPQVVLLLESRKGEQPREVLRALGTMIMMMREPSGIARILDRATAPQPDQR